MTTDAARARMSHVTRHLPLGQKPLQVNGGEVIVSPHFVKSDDAAAGERKPQDTVTCHRSHVTACCWGGAVYLWSVFPSMRSTEVVGVRSRRKTGSRKRAQTKAHLQTQTQAQAQTHKDTHLLWAA